jgi:hypothetical protein
LDISLVVETTDGRRLGSVCGSCEQQHQLGLSFNDCTTR